MLAKRNKFDLVIEGICLLCMVLTVVFLVIQWNSLPDIIASHYNASGQIDGMKDKSFLIGLQAIAWIMYGILSTIGCLPQMWNTGFTITEQNKEMVYRLMKHMLVILKLIVVLIFCYLTIYSATGENLPSLFLPIAMFGIFGNMAFWFVKIYRENQALKNE